MKRAVLAGFLVALACGRTDAEPLAEGAGAGGEASVAGQSTAGSVSGGGASSVTGGTGGAEGGTGSAEGGTSSAAGAAASSGVGASGGGADGVGGCGDGAELSPWPGSSSVVTLDAQDDFTSDLSGLTYESPGVLWAVNNLSAKLYRLVQSGAGYTADGANDWAAGKRLRFPDGQRIPDAEGVTFAASSGSGIYVSSERDLNDAQVSRASVLRYDVSAAGATLTATHEWDVTALLPEVGPNAGLESITWVADEWLTAHGFVDESRDAPYAPGSYGEHGGGVFFVGVEQTGKVYGLALNHTTGAATLLATISTPFPGVMGLEMDRDAGALWAYCDDTCGNQAALLTLGESGHFELKRHFRAPAGLLDSNHEGIALAPDSECSDGHKPFFWTDDADGGGFTLHQGALSCDCR